MAQAHQSDPAAAAQSAEAPGFRLRLLPPPRPQTAWFRLLFGSVCGVGAVLLRLPLEPVLNGGAPFVFFLPGVTVAAVRCGVLGAAPATLIGLAYFALGGSEPMRPSLGTALPFLLFLLASALITAVAVELRLALTRLRRQEDALVVDRDRARLAEAALREREGQLHRERSMLKAVFDSAPIGLSITEASQGRSVLINGEMRRILGRDVSGGGFARYRDVGAIHPDGRPYAIEDYPSVRALRTGEPIRAEPFLLRRPDGLDLRAEVSSAPIRDAEGEIAATITVLVDVEGRERAIEHQQLLMNELSHRMKNTLTMVQAIVSQTLRTAESTESARTDIMQRLSVLSRAQDVLTRSSWTSAALADTVHAALAPVALEPDRLSLDGPEVRLGSRAALSFTLALHELATNAVKYGALSVPSGRVALRWRLDPDPAGERLTFIWKETGGPAVLPPETKGFGSRLIETLSRAFSGESAIRYEADGVCWEVTARLESLQAF